MRSTLCCACKPISIHILRRSVLANPHIDEIITNISVSRDTSSTNKRITLLISKINIKNTIIHKESSNQWIGFTTIRLIKLDYIYSQRSCNIYIENILL